jgi:hypothetical protein
MPGQRAGQKVRSHLAVSAEDRNEKEILEILNGEKTTPFLFGRIETNLGAYFRVKIHDGRTLRDAQASPRGLFRHRKAHMRFHKDEIVVLEGSIDESMTDTERAAKKALVYEIIAKLSKKQAQICYRRGMIHKSVYTAPSANGEDDDIGDLIDYGEGEEEELDSEEEREITRGGRGSGGKRRAAGGGAGAAARATAIVREQLDAETYAEQVQGEAVGGEEGAAEDLEAMADGLGMGGEGGEHSQRKKDDLWDTPVPGSAAATAAAATKPVVPSSQEDTTFDEHAEDNAESWTMNTLKTKDRWDDSDSELDIDDI